MRLSLATLSLVRGTAVVAISTLSACGGASTPPPVSAPPPQVAQVSAPADPPATQNVSTSVSTTEPVYAVECGRG